jgi:hypothetical protein
LQLDVRHSFTSATEAHAGLEALLANERLYSTDINTVTSFLAGYHGSSEARVAGVPVPIPPHEPALEGPAPIVVQPVLCDPPSGETPPALFTQAEIQPPVAAPETMRAEAKPEAKDLLRTITATAEPQFVAQSRLPANRSWIAAGVALAAVAVALLVGPRFMPSATAASTGTLIVTTNPPGAQIIVDNVPRGQAPLNLSLEHGPHSLVVRGHGEPRTLPVTIVAGAASSHYLDLPSAALTTGTLQIRTDPSGARVTVDGQAKGITPLTLTDLDAGEHSVTLENEFGSANHSVLVQPGIPATLVVPLGAPQGAIVSGWLSVSAPLELQIYEQGRLLGTSSIDRIMLAAGTHDIEVVNEPLGFRMARTIQVSPGKVSPFAVVLPKGVVSLNAIPWATVSIDGQIVGETPIGNLLVPIGAHEVVFTNPQLGEQRRVITVTLKEPVRASIDLSRK